MRLLITGANGQLGREMALAAHGNEVLALNSEGLDITDARAVDLAITNFRPDAVVNAAAYTAVDSAEADRELAFAVNQNGPANLAMASNAAGAALIHVSTDYVFNGKKSSAYIEEDPTEPLGVYGASKLAGEEAVRSFCPRHVILRTSWVFSAHGKNFVKTMLNLGSGRDELGVVVDQHGCPTAAAELSRGIMMVLGSRDSCGTYHFCQPEPTTWYGFSEAIFDEAKRQGAGLKINHLKPISTINFPTPAKRPVNSVMECRRFESSFDFQIRPWRESLVEVISELQWGRGCER